MTKRAASSNIAFPQAMQRLVSSQAPGGHATVVSDDGPISNKSADKAAANFLAFDRTEADQNSMLVLRVGGVDGATSPIGVNPNPGRSKCR